MKFSIVPQPKKFSQESETIVFTLGKLTEIICDRESEKAEKDLLFCLKVSFELEPIGTGKERIYLSVDRRMKEPESYCLSVKRDEIRITGADSAGVFYGVQSLKQLLIEGDLELAEIEIDDSPALGYRGFMLDSARYFFSKEAVFVFLDMMAIHKLNYFHWHLSDDQGFRVELFDNILMSQIGSYRQYTNFNNIPHSGFYSQEDIREIVRYAHGRFIKIIPEIDSPGHVVSMIAANGKLSCFNRQLMVATHSGVKHDVLCVGKESTFKIMKSVFDELIELFPDKIIHIGGDEVPTMRWELCPHCQKRMKDENLKNEKQLHTYYLNRIARYLRSKGIKVIMWNDTEIDENYPIDKETAWQLWDSAISNKQLEKELSSGRQFINSSSAAYYLDLPYGNISLEKCYNYNPIPETLSENAKANLVGVESCLWSEYVPTMKKAGYCTYPRLAAFSENAWTSQDNKDYGRFLSFMDNYYKILDCFGIDSASLRQANPSFIRKNGYLLYWERRKLHWQGLHNILDDRKVKKLALKINAEDNK